MATLGSTRKLHVLLVEDNPGDARYMQEVFQRSGLDVSSMTATSGEAALELLQRWSTSSEDNLPDIVFLDLHLPGMSGVDFLGEIRSRPKTSSLPVVVLTGSLPELEELNAQGLRVEAYLRKPIGPEHVRALLDRLDIALA
ncbi:MAG: response regulator [Euryarchaeota archaeon]|nr:response regulator [Euryarchaeota archaeon]MDE1837115.1 response regulator [Euryarchaeota archaeon]MDE1879673.1 response regulator [Euryarchaeota archaeon]MDE2045199.1 response regulator [Thermoplasmata archaeon]